MSYELKVKSYMLILTRYISIFVILNFEEYIFTFDSSGTYFSALNFQLLTFN